MKVLLTGGTGLLGSHLVEQGLALGHDLTILVRDIPSRSFLGHHTSNGKRENLTLQQGSLTDPKIEGRFDAVIHAAAKTSASPDDQDTIWKVNYEGTKSLYNHLDGRFRKWVQISSIATICDGHKSVVSEQDFGDVRETEYAKSKLAADKWIEEKNPQALLIHPCYMLGRWDARPSSGAIFHAVRFDRIRHFWDVQKNFVAASDVATGVWQGLDRQAVGHYILAGENVRLGHFFDRLTIELGIQNKMITVDRDHLASSFEREFCLTSAVESQKAQNDFGYSPKKNLDQMLKEAMDFFEESRMLRRSRAKMS